MKQQSISLQMIVGLLIIASLVTSCGGGEQSSLPYDLGAATVHWTTWDTNSKAETILIDSFHERYPQIEFQRQEQQGPTLSVFQSAPPDLLNIDVDKDFYQLIGEGKLADLSELWQETGLYDQIPASLQKLSERDGKQYYLPFGFGWVGFYYNKQIFADYNLQAPQTWEEFLQVCETLVLAGETPLSLAGAEPWVSHEWFEYLNLRVNGPEFHRRLVEGKESFIDSRVVDVLERWQSLFDLGYFPEDAKYVQSLEALTNIARGQKMEISASSKAVMTLSDAYNASQLPAPFMQQLGFFRFPIIDPSLPVAETIDAFGYVIPVGADNPSHAIAFLHDLGSAKSQILVAHQGLFSDVTYAPVRSDVEKAGMRADQLAAMEMVDSADETMPFLWLALPDSTWGAMQYYFTRFVAERDVDTFIEKLEEVRLDGIKKGILSEG